MGGNESIEKRNVPKKIKLTTVGDRKSMKTALLHTYFRGEYPEEYVPTVFDNQEKVVKMEDGTTFTIELWDTAGQEKTANLRPISYIGTSTFLLCFSMVDRESFERVRNYWAPEILFVHPQSQVVLIGTETDLMENEITQEKLKKQGQSNITDKEAQEIVELFRLSCFMKCSARRNEGVQEVIRKAGEVFIEHGKRNKRDIKRIQVNVTRSIGLMEFTCSEITSNRELVLECVERNGLDLKYASSELKNDKELVMVAINQNQNAFDFCDEELKNDPEVRKAAGKED